MGYEKDRNSFDDNVLCVLKKYQMKVTSRRINVLYLIRRRSFQSFLNDVLHLPTYTRERERGL